MPTAFDATTSPDLPSLFSPLWSLLDLLPADAAAPIVLGATVTTAAALILAAARGRAAPAMAKPSGPGSMMSREEALGHVRAYSGDLERPIRSIVNTQSGDPEHAPDLA